MTLQPAQGGQRFAPGRATTPLKPHNARKELLTKALKISRGMMPTVYQVVDHCARTLELTSDIEVYVNQDSLCLLFIGSTRIRVGKF